MALTLVSTPGDSAANSYCSIAEADAYHDFRLHASTWDAAGQDQKIQALVMATRVLDEQVEWNGYVHSVSQSLRWPRQMVLDRDGRLYFDHETIPTFLKNATAELARYLLEGNRPGTLDSSMSGVESVKVGTVEVKFDKMDRIATLPESVMAMIHFVVADRLGSNNVKVERS